MRSSFDRPTRRSRLYMVLTFKLPVRLARPLSELNVTLGLPWGSAPSQELLAGSFGITTPSFSHRRIIECSAIGKVRDREGLYDVSQRPSSGRGRACAGTDLFFALTAHTSNDHWRHS